VPAEEPSKIDLGFDTDDLEKLAYWTMPFGRFRGTPLIDLPEEYLLWFERSEFPAGELGRLMQLCLGIKLSGTEAVVKKLRG
jgi:uncharacterized protein (DUF3820 family)